MDAPHKIGSFRDLHAWQQSYQFALAIYQASRRFPREELFAMVSQIRRAAVSIASNIAEGFSRSSPKEKTQFYYVSLSSLTEVRNQLDLSLGIGYLSLTDYRQLEDKAIRIDKLLHGLIRKSKTFIRNT